MAVEDHPLYPKWKAKLERLIEAKERFRDLKGTKDESAAKQDYDQALRDYEKIVDEI